MPTGYTAGILDGEVKTFEQFIKKCVRAFGASMHMRDEKMDKEFEPRAPSDYYDNKAKEYSKELMEMESKPPEFFVNIKKENLLYSIENDEKRLEERKKNRIILENMLEEVQAWTPPTEEHAGLKTFMIDQLTTTIDSDCRETYIKQSIENSKEELKKLESIDPEVVKDEEINYLKKQIKDAKEEYAKEVKRCKDSNQWVEQVYKSINK